MASAGLASGSSQDRSGCGAELFDPFEVGGAHRHRAAPAQACGADRSWRAPLLDGFGMGKAGEPGARSGGRHRRAGWIGPIRASGLRPPGGAGRGGARKDRSSQWRSNASAPASSPTALRFLPTMRPAHDFSRGKRGVETGRRQPTEENGASRRERDRRLVGCSGRVSRRCGRQRGSSGAGPRLGTLPDGGALSAGTSPIPNSRLSASRLEAAARMAMPAVSGGSGRVHPWAAMIR